MAQNAGDDEFQTKPPVSFAEEMSFVGDQEHHPSGDGVVVSHKQLELLASHHQDVDGVDEPQLVLDVLRAAERPETRSPTAPRLRDRLRSISPARARDGTTCTAS